MESLAYACGSKPTASGVIKRTPQDFQVDELLGFDLDTHGDAECPHNWLHIRKIGINTSYLAQLLAQSTGYNLRDIGYSGMKDRHAVTTQWFSVPSSDKESISGFEQAISRELAGTSQKVELLTSVAHPKKLKRGVHRKNRFKIVIRDLHELDESTLERIKEQGVPNYFGNQRFGKRFANLSKAEAMFEKNPRRVKREQRGIYLSTARSFLFNQIVSARLNQGSWLRPLVAEPINLNASGSIFISDLGDVNIEDRIISGDVHTTGALWGSHPAEQELTEIGVFENQVVGEWPILRDGLLKFGLKASRRPLRVMLENFSWLFNGTDLELNFELAKGAYATCVLREILSFNDTSSQDPDATN
jgi:tRNA pseudouridine13 synthase